MTHAVHRVVRFDVVGPFVLEVHFDDGSRKVLELAELKLIAWTAR